MSNPRPHPGSEPLNARGITRPRTELCVAKVSEQDILDLIGPLLPQGENVEIGPGDDAAILHLPSSRLVITTDTMTEGQDFLRDCAPPYSIGHKAAVQNMADIAAMGAQPMALVVSLTLPADLPLDWISQFAQGISQRAARDGASIVGGDLGAGPCLSITVTATGALTHPAITRSGAQAGDVLAIGGKALGRSAAGLAAILSGKPPAIAQPLIEVHHAPDPDLRLGYEVARTGKVHAMMDLSDGLVRDTGRIARASNVRVDLDPEALKADIHELLPCARALLKDTCDPAALTERARAMALDWVLHGGEEHLMLASFAQDGVPKGFRVIGRLIAADAHRGLRSGPWVTYGGAPIAGAGFDHFHQTG
ncbi:thiamine-phosphate kinase [Devriesea agamarum]|uniref:thiamine-phosphate kinase n=1 Tax=Devriesea agamarum TaxID=472569 RepID=UPI0009FE805B|nr:thiamine-phosphate kinase [Devriesea agamarum]